MIFRKRNIKKIYITHILYFNRFTETNFYPGLIWKENFLDIKIKINQIMS